MSYLLDGWIPASDVSLLYAEKGTGKTTLAVAMCLALAKAEPFLDRTSRPDAARSMFIATDSGLMPLNNAMDQLGMDRDDAMFAPGHKDQMIFFKGLASDQGHRSWACDFQGVIELEALIRKYGLKLVVIDSAKSVSSAAGWSYTSNESVKAILTYLRECICEPLGCSIVILSHDGTAKGSHSGAKAWAEDPSMVISLQKSFDGTGKRSGVVAEFIKDRAACFDPHRKVTYMLDLNMCGFVLSPEVEKVGNCEEAILEILFDAYKRGIEWVAKKDMVNEAMGAYGLKEKTVNNSLTPLCRSRKITRKGPGRYSLTPGQIQLMENVASNRAPSIEGRNMGETQSPTGVLPVPDCFPVAQAGNCDFPHGNSPGIASIPVTATDLGGCPPGEDLPLTGGPFDPGDFDEFSF